MQRLRPQFTEEERARCFSHLAFQPIPLISLMALALAAIACGGTPSEVNNLAQGLHPGELTDGGIVPLDQPEQAEEPAEGALPDGPPPKETASDIGPIELEETVAGQTCNPIFKGDGTFDTREPGYQVYWVFVGPGEEKQIHGRVLSEIILPDGSRRYEVEIKKDTSSGKSTAHVADKDPELKPGIYEWRITSILTEDGLEVDLANPLEGVFEVTQRQIDGCINVRN